MLPQQARLQNGEDEKRPRGYLAKEQGKRNMEMIREFFASHLCATNEECSKALGLSVFAVGRHARKIRAEWSAPLSRNEGDK